MGQVGIPFGYGQGEASLYNYFYYGLANAHYIVGAPEPDLPNSILKRYMKDNFDLDVYPASPNVLNDEFEDLVIDGKWTKILEPAPPNSFDESKYPGFLWVGLPQVTVANDNYDYFPQLVQAPPSSSEVWEFIAKVAIVAQNDIIPLGDWGSYNGKYASITLALIDSIKKDWLGITFEVSATEVTKGKYFQSQANLASSPPTMSVSPGSLQGRVPLSQPIYLKIKKLTTNPYTSSNDYQTFISLNGVTWVFVDGAYSKTFANPCDRIGFLFRPPLPGTTAGYISYALSDFFRRTI